MQKYRLISLAALPLLGAGLLTACDSGVDTLPDITINLPSTGGGGTTDPDPDPVADPNITGSVGTASAAAVKAISGDPWALADFFAGNASATPLNNKTTVVGQVETNGYPKTGNTLTAAFTKPAQWPPVSANISGASSGPQLDVPDYIGSTNYIGAYDPSVAFANSWTAGWTVAIHGNTENWKFANVGASAALSAPSSTNTCPTGTTFLAKFSATFGPLSNDEAGLFTGAAGAGDYDICRLPARFDGTATTGGTAITLTNDNVYVVAAATPGTKIGFGDDTDTANDVAVTVTIEPGTLVYGVNGTALNVTRGAKLIAKGTATAPIVMTGRDQLSTRFDGILATPVDTTARGLWGGVTMSGKALLNVAGCGLAPATCNVNAEFGTGNYGGNDNNDSSGELDYVVIKHAGFQILPDQELNGLTLGAVGRGTRIQHIQIHRGLDDGVEFFGGSAFIRYLAVTAADDDSLDWDHGWTGGVQNFLAIQRDDGSAGRSNRGIEGDSRNAPEPITFPLIANMTILGPKDRIGINAGANAADDFGIFLTEGTRVQFWNSIVTGSFPGGGLEIGDLGSTAANVFGRAAEAGGTAPNAPGPHFVFRNSIIDVLDGANFKQD